MDGDGIPCEIALRWMSPDLTDGKSKLVGNGLLPAGSKPLPEPMATQIYVAIGGH